MSDDLTILHLDVDPETLRWLLDAVPGLSPAALDDEVSSDDAEASAPTSTPTPATPRTGPRHGETPPPGAGDAGEEADRSTVTTDESEDRSRTLLLAGGAVAGLGVLAGAAVFLARRRSGPGDVGGLDGVPVDTSELPLVGDDTAPTEPSADELPGATSGGATSHGASPAERADAHLDAAPIAVMGLLAVGAVLVRRLRSRT